MEQRSNLIDEQIVFEKSEFSLYKKMMVQVTDIPDVFSGLFVVEDVHIGLI